MRWHYPHFTDVATEAQSLSILTKITQIVTKPGSKFKWSVIKFSLPCSKYFHIITPIAEMLMKLATLMNANVEKAQICFLKMLLLIGMPHKHQKFRTALSNKNKMRTTNVSYAWTFKFSSNHIKKMGGLCTEKQHTSSDCSFQISF